MSFLSNGIQIGPLFIHYYGIILLSGALIGTLLASHLGKRHGFSSEVYWEMLPWALIFGIIGARLWHVLMPSSSSGITLSYYFQHPAEIFAIWNGGLGIPGAIMGGAMGVWLFCKKDGFLFAPLADSAAPGIALAQAIGRWGNYVNQELYGKPTNLPWGITIDPANRIAEYADQAVYHPLFLYESLYNLLVMSLLLWLDGKHTNRLHDGSLILVYAIAYPVGRFFLEFLRLDQSMIGELNANQLWMACIAITATIGLIINERRNKPSVVEF